MSLTVVLVAKYWSSAGGTMELRPGGKDSVGKSQGKDPKPGSFELYISAQPAMFRSTIKRISQSASRAREVSLPAKNVGLHLRILSTSATEPRTAFDSSFLLLAQLFTLTWGGKAQNADIATAAPGLLTLNGPGLAAAIAVTRNPFFA